MATSGKPLAPAEISTLERAFASDPGSDAYRPLTEAYVEAGRFMEAMVVCKKGVRAHPDDPAPKVLLARVYAEQGKDRKALEELGAVLAAFPTFVAANRLAATLHFRLGEKEPGEAALRRAARGGAGAAAGRRGGAGRSGGPRAALEARRDRPSTCSGRAKPLGSGRAGSAHRRRPAGRPA